MSSINYAAEFERAQLKLLRLFTSMQATYGLLEELVQTNGTAHCFDRYCHDDDWTYCIYCEVGDLDPHAPSGWTHAPDCLVVRARAFLDTRTQGDI